MAATVALRMVTLRQTDRSPGPRQADRVPGPRLAHGALGPRLAW